MKTTILKSKFDLLIKVVILMVTINAIVWVIMVLNDDGTSFIVPASISVIVFIICVLRYFFSTLTSRSITIGGNMFCFKRTYAYNMSNKRILLIKTKLDNDKFKNKLKAHPKRINMLIVDFETVFNKVKVLKFMSTAKHHKFDQMVEKRKIKELISQYKSIGERKVKIHVLTKKDVSKNTPIKSN